MKLFEIIPHSLSITKYLVASSLQEAAQEYPHANSVTYLGEVEIAAGGKICCCASDDSDHQ